MKPEKTKTERVATGADPFSDAFGAAVAEPTGRVQVIHGVYAHSLPLAGMSVAKARIALKERMNIAPEAIAVIDGVEIADEEYVTITENQVLNFVTPAGEKG